MFKQGRFREENITKALSNKKKKEVFPHRWDELTEHKP